MNVSEFSKTHSRKIVVSAIVFFSVILACLPVTDEVGQSHVDTAFKRALVGYALARGLNGVVSVAQGTEVAIQPAGVGVNFTPGQILDPVNDLVIALTGGALLLAQFWSRLTAAKWILQRLFLFALLLRFMMPAISIANDWVYRTFLENDYVQAQKISMIRQ